MLPAAAGVAALSLLTILGFAGSHLTAKTNQAANGYLDTYYANIPLTKVLRRFLDRPMRSEKKLSKRAVAYTYRAHEHCHSMSNATILPQEVLAAKPDLTGALVIAPNWFFKSNMEAHYGIIMRRCPKKRGHWEVVFPVEKDCKTYELPETDLTSWPIALAPFRAQPTLAAAERRRARAAAASTQPLRRSDRIAEKNAREQTPVTVPTPPQSPRRPTAAPRPARPAAPTPPSRRRSPRVNPTPDPTPSPVPTPTPSSPCRHPEARVPSPSGPAPTPAYVPPHLRHASPVPSPSAATAHKAPTRPAEPQYVDVAFHGLGTHGGPGELAAATQTVINWTHSVLGISLGRVQVIKRTRRRYTEPGRHPDIVVVRMTRAAKRKLFNAKRALAGHISISIDHHREGQAHHDRCQQRQARSAAPQPAPATTNPNRTPEPRVTRPPPPPAPRATPAAPPCTAASGAGPSRLNPAAAPYTPAAAPTGQGNTSRAPQNPTSGPGEGSGAGSGAGPSRGDGSGGTDGSAHE